MRLAVLLALGLALRIAACEYALANDLLRFPDTELYQAYAERIERAEPYAVGADAAQRTPGYPIFLAACWRAFGRSDRTVLWIQSAFSTATCLLVWQLTRSATEGDSTASFAALTMAVLEPFSIVAAATQLTECTFTFLLTAAACLLAASLMQGNQQFESTSPTDMVPGRNFGLRRALYWAAAGVLAGAATMVRPSALFLAACFPMIVAASLGRRTRGPCMIALLTLAAALAPWVIRNGRLFGALIPTTLNVGESLYDGLNPAATGASDMSFAARPEVRHMPELDRDRHWRDRALEFARGNPARVLELAAIKFQRFWSPWPNEAKFRSRWVNALTGLASMGAYGLAALGIVRLQRPWLALGLLAPAAYFCALHMIFVSSVRYRTPVMPFLDVLAGIGAAWLWRRFQPGGAGD